MRDDSIAFVLGYVALVLILTVANINILGLGDPKFGENVKAIVIYSFIWGVSYATPFATVLFVSRKNENNKRRIVYRSIGLVLILAWFEVSFLYDTHWKVLLGEIVLLCLALIVIKNRIELWFR